MKLRFQADADLDRRIVAGLLRVEPSIDFEVGPHEKFEGVPDPDVLNYCVECERVLVTHDAKTMPIHFAEFVAEQSSPGVILVPQSLSIRDSIDELYLIWSASEAEEWQNMIMRLPL